MGVEGSGGLSGVTLSGRRFPASSAPGDFSCFGVEGRPGDFCGGLPGDGAVALLFFFAGVEYFFGGRERTGVRGSDRFVHDFRTPSRSFR